MKIIKKLMCYFSLPVISLTAFSLIGTTSCAKNDSLTDVINKLLSIKEIKHIDIYPNVKGFNHKLILFVEQPIDWNDTSIGTFTQRVELGFNSFSNTNVVYISGYDLPEKRFSQELNNELVSRYSANYINMEYRYHGQSMIKSIPYQPGTANYWKYLTVNNAIKDFHHTISLLKTLFNGKWILSGGSKGAQTIDTYAMLYPHDADAFVSYVGPRCHLNSASETISESNDGILKYTLSDVGNESTMGADAAEAKRFEIFKFQNYLLTQDPSFIKDALYNQLIANNCYFNDYVNNHHEYLFYYSVMDMPISIWQYDDSIDEIKRINNIESASDKLAAAQKYILDTNTDSECSPNHSLGPYMVQGWKEMGLYNLNPQLYIDKTKEYNTKYSLSLPVPSFSGLETTDYAKFRYKCVFTEDVMKNVTYDSTLKTALDAWTSSNEANVVMIFGAKDPWSAYKWPTISSNKIHVFINKDNPHTSKINNLDEENKKKCWDLIDSWLR